MDSIFSDFSTHHYDGVTCVGLFFIAWLALDLPGHNTAGTTENKGLSKVVLIEDEGAIHCWDTALVAAMDSAPFD